MTAPHPSSRGCTVQIRRNADGVIRNHQETLPWNGPYIWEDGNYSCDCNRSLFFARAANEPEPEDAGCGDGAFSVRIVDENMNELYVDESWPDKRIRYLELQERKAQRRNMPAIVARDWPVTVKRIDGT